MSDSKLFGRKKGKCRMSLRITMMAFIICALFVAGGIGYKDYRELNKLYFVIDMETSASGVVQVFYDVGSGYNEADSYTITEQSGSWQKLIFPLSPSKAIRSIRFDPINVPSLVRIKNAWIENKQGAVVKVFPLSDFKKVQQIDKMDISEGTLNILTQKNASDPITQIEKSSIESQCSWKDYMAKRSSIIIGYGLLISLVLTGMSYFSSKVQRLNAAVGEKLKEGIASIGLVSSIALSILVVVRWWYYIDSYSVNILFWDQWDFYNALFDKKNMWELFHMQFGPHRMGVGFIFTKAIASFSGWNTRAEDFAIGGVVCLAMVVALVLRTKLGPRLCWTDIAIPLIFLTPIQYRIYSWNAYPVVTARFRCSCLRCTVSSGRSWRGLWRMWRHTCSELSVDLYRVWRFRRDDHAMPFLCGGIPCASRARPKRPLACADRCDGFTSVGGIILHRISVLSGDRRLPVSGTRMVALSAIHGVDAGQLLWC